MIELIRVPVKAQGKRLLVGLVLYSVTKSALMDPRALSKFGAK